jgi:hypothetical protein
MQTNTLHFFPVAADFLSIFRQKDNISVVTILEITYKHGFRCPRWLFQEQKYLNPF